MEGDCVRRVLALLEKAGTRLAKWLKGSRLRYWRACRCAPRERRLSWEGRKEPGGCPMGAKYVSGVMGVGEDFGTSGMRSARGNAQPSTPDLCWQEEGDLGCGGPAEQCAALIPWREEKAEPRAAGRSSSTEAPARRKGAADAPKRRCGGMGFAPTGVAVPGEQHLGPSGMQWGLSAQYVDAASCGGSNPEALQQGCRG
ncbi:hypothetical protein NDU88_010554 [Pleurodeles waltl]|uniref:Uncharacterized protein n=1 Tax=Pleurodeles waltl TaxID=8319 RepID=A0AAV7RZL7_PLEWA|nr:hypothetical protein NDU88_010554 [Pleurodeles waltl]